MMNPSLNFVVLCFLGAMVLIAEQTDATVSSCSSGYCYNGGSCITRQGSSVVKCRCLPGYVGDRCQHSSCGCAEIACLNGGSRYCIGREPRCLCRPTYSGSRCQYGGCPKGYCHNKGTCYRRGLFFLCRCPPGYWGRLCEFQCYDSYCANGGTCITVGNAPRCRCPVSFSGDRCTQFQSACLSGYCYNGGTCTAKGDSLSCRCYPGYVGSRCEYTPCTHVRCPFHGFCELQNHKPVCTCRKNCPKINRPVCGSDGNEYGNSCLLRQASCLQKKYIRITREGGCGQGEQCSIDDVINFVMKALPEGSVQVNNQFIEALFQVIKGMLASRSNPEKVKIDELIERIEQAMKSKEFSYARTVLGFILGKLPNCRSFGAAVIQKIKDKVGDSIFKDIFSANGDVSLIFAVDTTGSMSEEISEAKKIAKAIASFKRRGQVNYILSPFNDPGSGPVQTFGYNNRSAFEAAIDKLRATGGGDCHELAFNGIIDAIQIGKPLPGSPMYVFTDAPPKNGSKSLYNKDNAIRIAEDHKIPVHFFFSTRGCGNPSGNPAFKEIIKQTGGNGLFFGRASDIGSADSLVKADLNGSVVIASGSSGPSKASDVTFPVDDSVMTLVVSIEAISNHGAVKLIDSTGKNLVPALNLVRGKLWSIENPSKGMWKLSVGSSIVLGLKYEVKASSEANINFDYIFFRTLKPSKISVPIPFPLTGEKANVRIILPQASRLDVASLKVDLVDQSGKVIKSVPLKNQVASFDLPSSKSFKLRLSGKTKSGNAFQRMSSEEIQPQDAMIRVQFKHMFLSLERSKTTSLGAAIDFVGSGNKVFSITATATPTNVGVKVKANSITVTKAKPGEIVVDLSVPADTPVDTVVKVQITATSGSLRLRLLAHIMVRK